MQFSTPTPQQPLQQQFNILMVEDDPVMQQRLQRILSIDFQTNQKLPQQPETERQPAPNNISLEAKASNPQYHSATTQILVAQSSQQTIQLLQHSTNIPLHLALLDLGLPDGHGLDLIAIMRQHHPNIIILVITVCATETVLLNCIQAGANGYLLKEREDFELAIAIKHALNGAMPIDPFMAKVLINLSNQKSNSVPTQQFELSNRELEILKLITQGFSNRDIAEQLHLSRFTIDTHIRNIYGKLAVNNRSKAIAAATKFKLF